MPHELIGIASLAILIIGFLGFPDVRFKLLFRAMGSSIPKLKVPAKGESFQTHETEVETRKGERCCLGNRDLASLTFQNRHELQR